MIGDRNAIIIAARVSGYGSDYDTKINCPSCNKSQEYSFNLEQPEITYALDSEELNNYEISKDENGLFHSTLPMSKMPITFRLLNGRDEKVILDKATTKTQNPNETNATDLLRMTIVSVNGISDRNEIEKFIQLMPARDSIYLKKLLKVVTPNVKFNNNFECRFCGFDTEMEVPFTADFFWVNR